MSSRWPVMMTRETAAEYCDMSAEQFDRNCPVTPIDQGWRGLRWKRTKLDNWVEALPEKPRMAKIGLDQPQPAAPLEELSRPLTKEERQAAALARL